LTGARQVVIILVMKPLRTIKAAEFKAKCLALMDQVARHGVPVVITKRGTPVAQLAPIVSRPSTLRGFMKRDGEILGDIVSRVDLEPMLSPSPDFTNPSPAPPRA
jgi:prevent-host-death family protein